jgi:hypothetical protein
MWTNSFFQKSYWPNSYWPDGGSGKVTGGGHGKGVGGKRTLAFLLEQEYQAMQREAFRQAASDRSAAYQRALLMGAVRMAERERFDHAFTEATNQLAQSVNQWNAERIEQVEFQKGVKSAQDAVLVMELL